MADYAPTPQNLNFSVQPSGGQQQPAAPAQSSSPPPLPGAEAFRQIAAQELGTSPAAAGVPGQTPGAPAQPNWTGQAQPLQPNQGQQFPAQQQAPQWNVPGQQQQPAANPNQMPSQQQAPPGIMSLAQQYGLSLQGDESAATRQLIELAARGQQAHQQLQQLAPYWQQIQQVIQPPQPAQQQQAEQKWYSDLWNAPTQFDPNFLAIRRDPESGKFLVPEGAPPDLLHRYQQWAEFEQKTMNQFRGNIPEFVRPIVEKIIDMRMPDYLNRLRQEEQEARYAQTVTRDPAFMAKVITQGPNGQQQMSPWGMVYQQMVENLHRAGLPTAQQHDIAVAYANNWASSQQQAAPSQQQTPPQGAPAQPQFQPQGFQPQQVGQQVMPTQAARIPPVNERMQANQNWLAQHQPSYGAALPVENVNGYQMPAYQHQQDPKTFFKKAFELNGVKLT